MPSDDALSTQLSRIEQALELLDAGSVDAAGELAERVIDELMGAIRDWQALEITPLLAALGSPRRGQALARALWIASTADEAQGRLGEAWRRGRRAIELYARLRMSIEELDVRAARELASASARLRERAPFET